MNNAIVLGVLLLSSYLTASAQEITIKSLAFTSLPYYSTTVYQVSPASSNTYCNSTGDGNINANVYSMPGGATVSGTTNTNINTNCTTTYRPAQNGQFTRRIIYNYNLVEGAGYRYELLCTANWIGSKCAYLIPGQSFQATIQGSDMLIAGINAKGKTKEVKYHVLAMAPYPSLPSKAEDSNPSSKPESGRILADLSTQQPGDVHVQPLVMSSIRLPKTVTSVAVGAPELFQVKRSEQDPQIVFIKANTPEVRTTNLMIMLQSGEKMNIRLISDIGAASNVVAPSPRVPIQADSTSSGRTTLAASIPNPVAQPLTELSLSSTPGGADIIVDGNFIGDTPSSLSLQAGDHLVSISLDGYHTWQRKIHTAGGKITLSATLVKTTMSPSAAVQNPKQ